MRTAGVLSAREAPILTGIVDDRRPVDGLAQAAGMELHDVGGALAVLRQRLAERSPGVAVAPERVVRGVAPDALPSLPRRPLVVSALAAGDIQSKKLEQLRESLAPIVNVIRQLGIEDTAAQRLLAQMLDEDRDDEKGKES